MAFGMTTAAVVKPAITSGRSHSFRYETSQSGNTDPGFAFSTDTVVGNCDSETKEKSSFPPECPQDNPFVNPLPCNELS